jgi:hypothetical protein
MLLADKQTPLKRNRLVGGASGSILYSPGLLGVLARFNSLGKRWFQSRITLPH